MQKVFYEVGTLDKKCYAQYGLSEDILMEHAATSIANYIEKNFKQNSKILIVSGVGNNGADGIALARLLYGKYQIELFLPNKTISNMGKIQLQRSTLLGVNIIEHYASLSLNYNVVVDCLFGSGLSRDLDNKNRELIDQLNMLDSYKIACDIPSGINSYGQVNSIAFQADTTITMGALKNSLFLDEGKEYIGRIIVSDLGVQREFYENNSDLCVLDIEDLQLPSRENLNTNKGNFGHLAVVVGQKQGAGIICADAAFNLGVGLVSVVNDEEYTVPYHIMQMSEIPHNCTAIAIGMGLGEYEQNEVLEIFHNNIPKVCDADLFYTVDILEILSKDNIVLTPHPKEFCSLLKLCEIAEIDIETLQKYRFKYVEIFCKKYPKVVLLLKGANTIVGQNKKLFINPLGTSKLSFGGSGDVLAGFIGSLLAQGYTSLNAAIQGTLIHTIIAMKYTKNNYSMTPTDLIEGVKNI